MHAFLSVVATALLQQGSVATPSGGHEATPIPTYDHAAIEAWVEALNSHEEVSAFRYGKSRGERDLWALQLRRGAPHDARPTILVVGGLSGPQAWNSAVVMDMAESLRSSSLLDDTTVILVPRANPDAAQLRFAQPLREARATGIGADDDRDGRMGEDPGMDLNNDGYITWMRVPDPEGTWMADPSDARLNVEADPLMGEHGLWRLVPEGRDKDGDQQAAEDDELDAEVNRNFPADWEEHTPRAGRYPAEAPEVQALCDLLVSRRDIQVVLVLGEQDNLIEKLNSVADDAPATHRVPKVGVRKSDAERMEQLAERWKAATELGFAGDRDEDHAGSFQAYSYAHRGLLTLNTRAWSVPLAEEEKAEKKAEEKEQEEGEAEAEEEQAIELSDAAKRLRWLDENGRTDAHLGWSDYEHPELGPVQIGGFRPYAEAEPHMQDLTDIGSRMAIFLEELGPDLARISLDATSLTDLGGGLYDLRASVVNNGWLPLRSTWGQRTRTTRLPSLTLTLPAGASLRAGRLRSMASDLGGGERQEFRWLVSLPGGDAAGAFQLDVDSDHAGLARTTFEEAK
jgi:hypothetical protein